MELSTVAPAGTPAFSLEESQVPCFLPQHTCPGTRAVLVPELPLPFLLLTASPVSLKFINAVTYPVNICSKQGSILAAEVTGATKADKILACVELAFCNRAKMADTLQLNISRQAVRSAKGKTSQAREEGKCYGPAGAVCHRRAEGPGSAWHLAFKRRPRASPELCGCPFQNRLT